MLLAKAFEVNESVYNTDGFRIDLDTSNIAEMTFDEVTEAMRNVDYENK